MCPDPGGYEIRLADGTEWVLTSGQELRPWLDQLASILELKTGWWRDSRRLIFSGSDETGEAQTTEVHPASRSAGARDEDSEGWRWSRRSSMATWSSSNGWEFVYAFPAEESHHAESRIMHMSHSLGPLYLGTVLGGGLSLHAALAEVNGQGVLFAGEGGAGKSTCSRRLPPPWMSWCDDQTLVVRGPAQGYRAHPFPTWSDYYWNHGSNKSWSTQSHVQISAIFFLEQAQGDAVIPLGAGEATVRISQSAKQILRIFWDGLPCKQKRRVTSRAFDNACAMATAIPAYRLSVSRDGRFWERVEEALAGLPR